MSIPSLFRPRRAPLTATERGDPTMVVVTDDPVLAERLARVAAAVDLRPEMRPPTGVIAGSRLVVVDARLLGAMPAPGSLRGLPILVVAPGELSADQWRVSLRLGVRGVHDLAEPDEVLVHLAAELAALSDSRADRAGRVVAVVGACGGAGASSMAVALGLGAQRRGETAVLCDTDRFGAGLEVITGLDRPARLCWGDIDAAGGRLPRGVLDEALPALPGGPGQLLVLGFGGAAREVLEPRAVAAVLESIRESGQLGVVDLTRSFDDSAMTAVDCADITVVIAPAEVRGCFGAARVAHRLADARLGLVVRGPSPSGLGAVEIAEAAGIPLITTMRPQPRLEYDVDIGRGPARRRGPLTTAAGAVLDYLREDL